MFSSEPDKSDYLDTQGHKGCSFKNKIYFARGETKNMRYIQGSSFKLPLSVISRDVQICFILATIELIVAVIAQEMLLYWMTAST